MPVEGAAEVLDGAGVQGAGCSLLRADLSGYCSALTSLAALAALAA